MYYHYSDSSEANSTSDGGGSIQCGTVGKEDMVLVVIFEVIVELDVTWPMPI